MSEPTSVASLFWALAPVLERFGRRWYVFGAQAVILWGRPRLTADADVTVHLDSDDPMGLVTAMREAGFELRVRDVENFVRRTRVLPFLHVSSHFPLDIVLAGPGLEDDFARDAIRVGRPKDLDDVRGVILAQGDDLDVPRVRRRLRRIENALDQSDLAPLFEAQLRRARCLD